MDSRDPDYWLDQYQQLKQSAKMARMFPHHYAKSAEWYERKAADAKRKSDAQFEFDPIVIECRYSIVSRFVRGLSEAEDWTEVYDATVLVNPTQDEVQKLLDSCRQWDDAWVKGLVSKGVFYVWETDENGMPHHAEVGEELGMDTDPDVGFVKHMRDADYFWVDRADTANTPSVMRALRGFMVSDKWL